jgi:hypothetical protein
METIPSQQQSNVFARMFGASWATTLWGSVTSIAIGVVMGSVTFPTNWHDPKQVITFGAVLIVTGSGVKFAAQTKQRDVSGGKVQQDTEGNVAAVSEPVPAPPQPAIPPSPLSH